jgi:hypothetical protein
MSAHLNRLCDVSIVNDLQMRHLTGYCNIFIKTQLIDICVAYSLLHVIRFDVLVLPVLLFGNTTHTILLNKIGYHCTFVQIEIRFQKTRTYLNCHFGMPPPAMA